MATVDRPTTHVTDSLANGKRDQGEETNDTSVSNNTKTLSKSDGDSVLSRPADTNTITDVHTISSNDADSAPPRYSTVPSEALARRQPDLQNYPIPTSELIDRSHESPEPVNPEGVAPRSTRSEPSLARTLGSPSPSAHGQQVMKTMSSSRGSPAASTERKRLDIRPDTEINGDSRFRSSVFKSATPLFALSSNPNPADCPKCGARQMTRVKSGSGNTTHAWAGGLFLLTIVGTFVPYLMSNTKDVHHQCGECGEKLATWHRSGRTVVHASRQN